MKNTFYKLAVLAGLSLGLLASSRATTLSVNWTTNTGAAGDFVGTIVDGTPANLADEVIYMNHLLGLGASASQVIVDANPIGSHTYTTSGTFDFGGTVSAVGALDYASNPPGTVVAGYQYLLAKYGQNDYVWYLGGLSFDVSSGFGEAAGLSHWVAFNPTTTKVPDSGMTAVLLGLGLVAVSFFARRRAA